MAELARQKRQEAVFGRWINTCIDRSGLVIEEGALTTGSLDDGYVLWHLLTAVSGQQLAKLGAPKTQIHKIENLNVSFAFLASEGIRLVGIAAEDILAHNTKLILGLIWTIIEKYQMRSTKNFREAKGEMVAWLQDALGLEVHNLVSSFQDGKNYIHLVNAMTGGFVDGSKITNDPLKNAQLALDVAHRALGIPKIVSAEDLVGGELDEKILLMYLHSFLNVQESIDATGFGYLDYSSISSAFSPQQLETGCSVKLTAKKPFTFCLKTVNVWDAAQIEIIAVNPVTETPLGCPTRVISAGENYWQLSVTPVVTGAIAITVQLRSTEDETLPPVAAAGFPIKGTVDVGPSDFLYVVNPNVAATKTVNAEILSDFTITAKYDDGTEIPIKFEPFILSFEPPRPGNVSLVVTRNNAHITGSPAKVVVTTAPTVKFTALPAGTKFVAGRKSMIPLDISNVDVSEVRVWVKDESGFEIDVAVEMMDGKAYATFVAEGPGKHTISAGSKGVQATEEMFIDVQPAPVIRRDPANNAAIYAGVPHHLDFFSQNVNPKELTVVAVDSTGAKVPVKVTHGSSGKFGLDFTAPNVGNISFRVVYGNDVTAQAVRPIVLDVLAKPICKFSAEALNRSRVARAKKPFSIPLDTLNVSLADLEVKITDEKGKIIPYYLDDSVLNKTSIVFTPSSAGKVKVECALKGQPIDGSPLPVTVQPAPHAKITKCPKECIAGKSVYFGLETNVTEYSEDVEGFSISLTDGHGTSVPFTFKDGKVKFTPKSEGRITFLVTVDGKPISGVPHDLNVLPAPSASIVGSSDRIAVPGKPFLFSIDTVNITDPKVLAITVTDPKGQAVPWTIAAASTASAEAELAEAFGKRTPAATPPPTTTTSSSGNRPGASGRPGARPAAAAAPAPTKGPTRPGQAARPAAISSARGLALLKYKTGGNMNTYRSLSYKEMKSMNENNKEGTYNVTFTPKTEGAYKVIVKLDDKSIQGSPLTVNVAGNITAKASGVDGMAMVNVESKCLLDIGISDPADFEIYLKYEDGTKQEEVIEPEPDGGYACNFVPTKEGKAILEILLKGKPIKGSPIPLDIGPEPWAKVIEKAKRAFLHEQYYFHIETSFNVPASDLEVKAVHASGATFICSVIAGSKKIHVDVDDESEAQPAPTVEFTDPTKEPKVYWGYWVSSAEGIVTTTITLHGAEIPGSPFTISVEREAEVFTSALPYSRLLPMPVDTERGMEIICQWQTRANTATPLVFSCAAYNDLGERTETLVEGQRFSSTAAIENRRINYADGNARALFIRPATLPSDITCIPIIVSCLKGDFSQIRKLVVCFCPHRGTLTLPGYVASSPRTETAFLAGIIAKNNFGQWTFNPDGYKFAYGRFITDLLPLMNKQITEYAPHKPEQRPFVLEKARAIPLHPNVGNLEIKTVLKWRLRSQDVDMTALPYCWGAKGGKYRIDVGGKGAGVENHPDKLAIDLSQIPEDVEAIVLVATVRGNKADDTIFSGLDSASLNIRASNIGEAKPSSSSTSSSSSKSSSRSKSVRSTSSTFYDLAVYNTTHTDVGAAGSLVMGKLYRRSLEAPWEFLPIGVGAVEVNIDELLWARENDQKANQFVVHDGMKGLGHFVRIGWRPVPKHCKIYLLEGSNLAPHPRTGSANPFVTFESIPKSNYHFDTKQSNVCSQTTAPSWTELFVFKDIGNHPKNDVSIMATVWDYDPIGSYDYMGDCKINLKKCFVDSVRNGGRSVDISFPLVKGGRKKVGLSATTSQRPSVTGELKLRFLCF